MNWRWLKIGRYALPQAPALALTFALMLIGTGVSLLMPWPMKLIVDSVLAEKPLPAAVQGLQALPGAASQPGLLAWLAAATVALFLCRRFLAIGRHYIETGAAVRMVYNLSTEIFHGLQRRSLLFHGKQQTGDLVQRVIEDTSCVRVLVVDVVLPTVTAMVTLIGTFFIVWRLDHRLAILTLSLALPLGLLIARFASPMTERKLQGKKLHGEMAALAEQTLTALPMVQAFGRESHQDARYRELAERAMRNKTSTLLTDHQFRAASSGLTTLATVAVTVIGSFSVLRGEITLGSLLVLLTYFASLYTPLESISYLYASFADASAGARRVLEVLAFDEDTVRDAPGAKPFHPPFDGSGSRVRFDHVSFGYEPDRPVLHDISLEVHPGETLALVGRTGAGKSTLAFLVPRLYDPWSGRVEIDGYDLRQVQIKSLRTNVAIVLQEPIVLPLTVAENIAYGRPEAARDQIVAAARAANAHDFIEALSEGYDTVIGERGMTLSVGQRQRLTIARALLMDAPILVMDEPTSALDTQTEASLLEALERLTRGRTTILIAHRLSTIRKADRIAVLESGRVVEIGKPAELAASGGRFATMLKLQTLESAVVDGPTRAAM